MKSPLQLTLANFDTETFLQNYWQQRPLLLRQALPADLFPLSPSELAGLACEDGIESRLISGDHQSGFALQHGPFEEATFTSLPERDWTVLVQAVDHVIPEVAGLLEYFRFIPNWRIDDVMVSYAAPGGSAGPHYDHYDVFLIQGAGTRLWRVGPDVGNSPTLCPHSELKLLSDFNSEQDWQLEPGDILYLPPRFSHWGISTSEDCMTYSVGFRSPSTAEILSDFCDQAIAGLSEHQRYQDPGLIWQPNPGEISTSAIDQVHSLVLEQFGDKARIARWLAENVTTPKYLPELQANDHDTDRLAFQTKLETHNTITRDYASRFAYITINNQTHLYVNGREYSLGTDTPSSDNPAMLAFAQAICASPTLSSTEIAHFMRHPELSLLILAMHQQGHLYFDNELYD